MLKIMKNLLPVSLSFKTFNAVSVINLFDVLGWGIDAATGAMMKPDQRAYEIMFAKPKANATE